MLILTCKIKQAEIRTMFFHLCSRRSIPPPPADIEGYVTVYVDGCCLGNGTENARAGIGVFWGDNHPWNIGQKSLKTTNNGAEIESVTKAVYQAKTSGVRYNPQS